MYPPRQPYPPRQVPIRPLDRDGVDRALAQLRAGYDRIASALYAVDNHTALAFLRGTGLVGTTASVAGEVQQLLTLLWAQFAALGTPLEEAETIRESRNRPGDKELAALNRLLREPVVALGAGDFPYDGAGNPLRRVRLAELAQVLESATTGLADLLTEVDEAVTAATGRAATLTSTVDRLATRVKALGPEAGRLVDLPGLSAAVDEVRARVLADPIEISRGGRAARDVEDRSQRLSSELRFANERLAEVHQVRQRHAELVGELAELAEAVAAAEAEATRSYQVAREKIANPGLPEVPAAGARLRGQLSGLAERVEREEWVRLADELAGLRHTATEAREYADRLRRAADGLLDRRAELRGRLDAYRAKAARLGHGEDPVLGARYREAHQLLYTRPCDLPAATRAVFSYQQALADLPRGRERTR